MDKNVIAVVLIGVVIGAAAGFLTTPPSPAANAPADHPDADAADRNPKMGEPFTYTVDTGEKLGNAKMHTHADVRNGTLQIADGQIGFQFYESLTFHMVTFDQLIVNVTVPAPDRTTVMAAVRSSPAPNFSQDGSYHITGQRRFTLKDGTNVLTVLPMQDSYYRVWFAMSRDSANITSPKITGYQINGTREPGVDVIVHNEP